MDDILKEHAATVKKSNPKQRKIKNTNVI